MASSSSWKQLSIWLRQKTGERETLCVVDGGEPQKLSQAWFCFDNNRNKWFSIQLEIERTIRWVPLNRSSVSSSSWSHHDGWEKETKKGKGESSMWCVRTVMVNVAAIMCEQKRKKWFCGFYTAIITNLAECAECWGGIAALPQRRHGQLNNHDGWKEETRKRGKGTGQSVLRTGNTKKIRCVWFCDFVDSNRANNLSLSSLRMNRLRIIVVMVNETTITKAEKKEPKRKGDANVTLSWEQDK